MKHDNELHNKDATRIAKTNKNIKNIQEMLKSLKHGEKVSLVDELIKERRRAAKEELK